MTRPQAHPGPDPVLPETVQRVQRVRQQELLQEQMLFICKPYVGSDAPMSVLCQRVERFLPELFTFVADPLVSADNNAAERSLRPAVVNLPGYSPDFNAGEAIWGWAREEATGNLCLGSKGRVQERVGSFLAGLASRKDEVKRHCRTVLQSRAEALLRDSRPDSQLPANAHPTLALV